MNHNSTKVTLASAALLLALAPAIALYHGWALWLMWDWFAVPLAPAITWHAAVGLMLLFSLLRLRVSKPSMASVSDVFREVFNCQVSVALVVGIGWCFHAIGFGAA